MTGPPQLTPLAEDEDEEPGGEKMGIAPKEVELEAFGTMCARGGALADALGGVGPLGGPPTFEFAVFTRPESSSSTILFQDNAAPPRHQSPLPSRCCLLRVAAVYGAPAGSIRPTSVSAHPFFSQSERSPCSEEDAEMPQ